MISFPVPASQQEQQQQQHQQRQNGDMRADKEAHLLYETCYDPFRHTSLGGQLQQQQQQQQQQHQQLGAVEQFQQSPDLHPFPASFQAPPDPCHFEPHQFHAAGSGPGADGAHQFQVPDPVPVHQFQAPDPLPQFQHGDLPGLSVRPVPSRRGGSGGGELTKPSSVRKFHKADREKLRRDKLNEQFAELAGVLDPDRPKNDKATILGDSVQTVRELRAEVKRLKAEHDALLDESRDLTQEKSELREEKSSLQTDTDSLQAQLQQRLQLIMPWVGMDVSAMMGGSPYPYPSVPMAPAAVRPQGGVAASGAAAAAAAPPPGQSQQQQQHALPYVPAPGAGAGFPIHPPPLQAFAMFGSRHGDGAVPPYMHYPHYPPPPSHSHVERPYAQYPSAMQPPPGYLMQMQAQVSGAPGPPFYRPYGAPGMPSSQPPPPPPPPPPAHEISQSGPEGEQSTSSHQPPSSHDHTDVQTVLQLKTGGNSSASGRVPQSTQGAGAASASGGKAQQPASTVSASSSLHKESVKREDSSGAPQASDASTPLDLSLRTTSAAPTASSQSASSAGSDVEGARGDGDIRHNQEAREQRRSPDPENPTTP